MCISEGMKPRLAVLKLTGDKKYEENCEASFMLSHSINSVTEVNSLIKSKNQCLIYMEIYYKDSEQVSVTVLDTGAELSCISLCKLKSLFPKMAFEFEKTK